MFLKIILIITFLLGVINALIQCINHDEFGESIVPLISAGLFLLFVIILDIISIVSILME